MLLCFGAFLAGVAACLVLGRSVLWALLLGLTLFSLLGLKMGFTPRQLEAQHGDEGTAGVRQVVECVGGDGDGARQGAGEELAQKQQDVQADARRAAEDAVGLP